MAESATEVEVVFPYSPTERNQLKLTPGERLRVHDTTSRGWWIGTKADGSMGLFPSAYCKAVERSQTFSVPLEEKRSQLMSPNGADSVSLVSSGTLSPNGSMQRRTAQRNARQQALMSELGIGDDDSGNFALGGSHFGGASSGAHERLVEEVATMRRLRAAVEHDLAQINAASKEMVSSLDERASGLKDLEAKRQAVVAEIKQMDAELQELNRVNEVLRCAFMGEPLPDYTPPGAAPPSDGAAASSAAEEVEEVVEEVEESDDDDNGAAGPSSSIASPDDITDAKAKKTAVKLLKRIEEAREVEASYAKKLHKVEKKKAKFRAAIDEANEARAAEAQKKAAAASEAEQAASAELVAAKEKLESAMKELDAADAEVAALEKAKAKALKKLKKGDAAREELEGQFGELRAACSGGDEALEELERTAAALQRELKEATAGLSDEEVAEKTRAIEAEEAAKSADIAARIAKEQSRIAEYQRAIEVAQQQAADGAG